MAEHHDHAGGHAHGAYEGHSHGVSADADRGKLAIALGLIVGFMAFEVAVGVASEASSRLLRSHASRPTACRSLIKTQLTAIHPGLLS